MLTRSYSFRKQGVFLVALFSMLLMFGAFSSLVCADQASAQAEIASAKSKLLTCYDSAKVAEAASANISQLTGILNYAGSLFSQAQWAYSQGDYEGAQSFAVQSQSALSSFVSTAGSLQTSASQAREQNFLFNFVGSIAGTVAVLVVSVALWVLLNRKYENQGGQNIEPATV